MNQYRYIIFAIFLVLFSPLGSMEHHEEEESSEPSKRQKTEDYNEIMWQKLKKQVQLLKELKEHPKFVAQQESPQTPRFPMGTWPLQSISHLRTLYGENKSEDELIREAKEVKEELKENAETDYFVKKLSKLAKQIIKVEKENGDYFVTYHGLESALGLVHDITAALYEWFNLETPHQRKLFLRFFKNESQEYINVDAYLKSVRRELNAYEKDISTYEYIEFEPAFDHIPKIAEHLLSVNFALFGNVNDADESSWDYFVEGKSINPPLLLAELKDFFQSLGLNINYAQKIVRIHEEYLRKTSFEAIIDEKVKTIPGGSLLQIFIDPFIIDTICYLSEPIGIPFDIKKQIEAAARTKDSDLLKKFQIFMEKIYSQTLQRPSVLLYLSLYRSSPREIPEIGFYNLDPLMDAIQGRLYLKYSIFNDPEKIKIFKYVTPARSPEQQQLFDAAEKEYKQQLNIIIEAAIKDWLFSRKQVAGPTRIEKLFNFLYLGM